MPTIRIDLFEGRTVEQKRELAKAITEATCKVLGGQPDGVDILFYDIKRQDWATGGELWSVKTKS
jgi:4-oxalocrotonate tautomerase